MNFKKDNRLYLVALILVVICLIILTSLLGKSLRKDGTYNYAKMSSILNVMYTGEQVTDRVTYWTLNDIISKYIKSYMSQDGETSYLEYYNILSDDYKNYLSRGKYETISKAFMEKFVVGKDDIPYMESLDLIKDMYILPNGDYIIRLNTNSSTVDGYIGIRVNERESTYKITYIE